MTIETQDLAGLLPRVSSMVFNKPMMIEVGKLNTIAQVLANYRGVELGSADVELLRAQYGVGRSARAEYEVTREGLALVPIEGTLLHKTGGLDALSGLMSYKTIEGQLALALGDDSVNQIALMIKSPGGDVHGCFDLAELIYQSRGVKPISAIVDETAASAAYLLASATSRIFVPQTAVVGSVGVVMRLENHTKQNEMRGVDVEYIYAGKKKVLGNPDEPITDEAREDKTATVNAVYDKFVGAIAKYQGLSESMVRGTEAGVYMGEAAVRIGLASDQMSVNEAIKTLTESKRGSHSMGEKTVATFTQDQVDALVDEAKVEAKAEGVAEGTKAGTEAEQTRVSAILALDGADQHTALVNKSIANPKFNAEDVKGFMEAMPVTATITAVAPDPLALEMAKIDNPDVGADSNPEADEISAMVQRISNAY